MSRLFVSLCLLISSISFAALIPIRTLNPKQITKSKIISYLEGFSLKIDTGIWAKKESLQSDIRDLYYTYFEAMPEGYFTVRTDQLATKSTLQGYVEQWTKEYPKFGLEVVDSKMVSENGNKGFLIDLLNPVQKKQLRQVIFLRDETVVLLTCSHSRTFFARFLPYCNEVLKSFTWRP